MESSFQSLEGMVDFVTINLSPFALAKELFFNCRVSNLVAAPAWNCEFAHATNCLKRFSTMCVSTMTSARRMMSPMNMEMF